MISDEEHDFFQNAAQRVYKSAKTQIKEALGSVASELDEWQRRFVHGVAWNGGTDELVGIIGKVRQAGRRETLTALQAPCLYSAAHSAQGVPATEVIDCGPVGLVPACAKCAGFYQRMSQGPATTDATPSAVQTTGDAPADADYNATLARVMGDLDKLHLAVPAMDGDELIDLREALDVLKTAIEREQGGREWVRRNEG